MKLAFITLKNQTWKVIKLLVLLLLLLSRLYTYHTLNDISKNEIYCNTGFILLSEFLENIWKVKALGKKTGCDIKLFMLA